MRGLTARTQRAEIYMRMIAYNLGVKIKETFYRADYITVKVLILPK